ncbi:MAG: ABC transporter substrate-binding protein [Bacteroidetes bacterium]|nr:ABC transporter substrate-binding protein [Bacteroidota bacterium]MBV6460054.1 Oligopeptide-binding protein AppA [Flavobacteriales bacterium]MCL4816404.1 hypothetical protein [Flavobacteriales bacterium]NOG95479.1 ABC transporter substrate-binding protein [Bacteroidota bacterium]WKZ73928.1 MAG: ABC transporter substrate-binding protein [Vicingaceae bacterium]
MFIRQIKFYSFLVVISFIAASCGGNKKKNNGNPIVIVHELSDAQMLNPVNYSDAAAGYIITNIYQNLLGIDFKTLELVPILAESRPEITTSPDSQLFITYRIREQARWDDGSPITAKDIEFSLKVIKNPRVDNLNNKPYFEFITDMKFYDDDPKKFTFVCKGVYILSEVMSGDIPALPEAIYDPKGIMKQFTIRQLSELQSDLAENERIIEFANDFNSEKYQRDKAFIQGSGAYLLEEWATGQKIVLKRKDNWWGDELKGTNVYFDANAPKIIYQTINDQTTALVALKAGNIDVMRGIKPKDFSELPKSSKYSENFNSHTPAQLAYTYLGINVRNPKLNDKKTRQALAHIVDVDKIINVVNYGYGEKAAGPVHPSKKDEYNPNLKPYEYNIDKAKQLLTESGWTDSDGDGILDKSIDGKKVPFTIELIYNSGNDVRKAICLLFQEEARKAGIKVDVITQEWSIFLDKTKQHEFEMYIGAWINTPIPSDHKQIFHTSSYNGGSNYTGFGNEITDALIDSIRVTLDPEKRRDMNFRFQSILHDECSYIFLYYPQERLAIHKRFENAQPSLMRPGYKEAAFTLKETETAE